MAIRLHEIEFGTNNVERSKCFYEGVLGLNPVLSQPALNVFNPGLPRLDFNTSTHFSSQIVCLSFITDNLNEIINRLKESGTPFEGPVSSHLGMQSISFRDPDGYLIKVNKATEASPEWLKC